MSADGHFPDDYKALVIADAFGTTISDDQAKTLASDPDRWRAAIVAIAADIDAQLAAHRGWAAERQDPTEYAERMKWKGRATAIKVRLTARIGHVTQLVKERNRTQAEQGWQTKFYALRNAIQTHHDTHVANGTTTNTDVALWSAMVDIGNRGGQ